MASVNEFFGVREHRQQLQKQLAEWGDKYQELGQMLQRWPALVLFHRTGESVAGVHGEIPHGKLKGFDIEEFAKVEEVAKLVQEFRNTQLEELRMYRALPDAVRSSISAPPSLW